MHQIAYLIGFFVLYVYFEALRHKPDFDVSVSVGVVKGIGVY